MRTSDSLLKEAEQNVIAQAKFFHDLLSFLDNFSYGTAVKMNSSTTNRDMFLSGMRKVKEAIYAEMQAAFSRCFVFVGVGGEEASKLSQEYAQEVFNGRYCQMRWLDQWYDIPRTWNDMDESRFNKEAADALKKQSKPKRRTTPTA